MSETPTQPIAASSFLAVRHFLPIQCSRSDASLDVLQLPPDFSLGIVHGNVLFRKHRVQLPIDMQCHL